MLLRGMIGEDKIDRSFAIAAKINNGIGVF
jgi:hypothetical protein